MNFNFFNEFLLDCYNQLKTKILIEVTKQVDNKSNKIFIQFQRLIA